MKNLFQKGRRRGLLLGAVALVCFVFLVASDRPASVEWLTAAPPARTARLGFLGAWAQPVRGVWHRLRGWMFGAPRLVYLRSDVFEFREAVGAANGPLPAAAFTNGLGLRVWLLSSNEWSTFGPAFLKTGQRLSSPSVCTMDGVPAQIFVGRTVLVQGVPQSVGLRLDVSPRVRGPFIDLAAFLKSTEVVTNFSDQAGGWAATNRISLRTNAALGVRLSLPRGGTALLLAARAEDGRSTGLVLTPDLLNVKK